ncbi:MAG TPA: ComF family protein [Candidatus Paceibacterota bacterium]|nr:ComF family protein [Verrucomicrobiota bacterium]HRY48268.1 ComF family protein [Candidatus Paceibacterota bacterium]HSA00770.1 ComF family protein [Candidatus Paceibacterota bacterium]
MDLAFTSARSAVTAKGVVLELIHRYKYQRALWLEPFLAGLLIRQALPVLSSQKWDVLAPVPLFPARQRQREFNQAERLAKNLSQATHIPVESRLLRRNRPTPSQTRLSRFQRADNVRNAFNVNPRFHIEGHHVLLVDDVFTTGATTNACARALKKAGAAQVAVWTLARGI